ncbi:hypothetical protein ABGX18_004395 [Salmonella enterica]|nr:hypothetical protein [Salmonella enterica]ECC2918320.1 hypothetical protein [Salmonella enterica subsp. enterica]ECS3874380.1 hypothetical protein [Salmonella enterica subsp. enterica serovar Litchfield]ECT8097918.1 hypothetical protein [Salmonella enterica subsp. enterica serovar Hartford]EDU1500305.1 hypothetical protein [Salmonella enterica subsp. enterica serovar Gaminara]EFO5703972.1 hypothetical protein [Salmonella enterica subsp. enterica serovar Anatum]
MSNEGFNPEDIEDTLSRFGRGQKKTIRSSTAGIPDFVPRKAKLQSSPVEISTKDEALWAAAADRAEQQQAQELPPTSPCFSQADIDEFLARKPKKYKMTERDYKELGRNIFLGAGDLIMSAAKISLYAAAHIPVSERQKDDDKILYYTSDSDGWGHAWTKNGKKY